MNGMIIYCVSWLVVVGISTIELICYFHEACVVSKPWKGTTNKVRLAQRSPHGLSAEWCCRAVDTNDVE